MWFLGISMLSFRWESRTQYLRRMLVFRFTAGIQIYLRSWLSVSRVHCSNQSSQHSIAPDKRCDRKKMKVDDDDDAVAELNFVFPSVHFCEFGFLSRLHLLIEKFVHGILIGHRFCFVCLFANRYSVAIDFLSTAIQWWIISCVRTYHMDWMQHMSAKFVVSIDLIWGVDLFQSHESHIVQLRAIVFMSASISSPTQILF